MTPDFDIERLFLQSLPAPLKETSIAVVREGLVECQRFKHSYFGTEHLLLGMVAREKDSTGKALINLGATLPRVRSMVEFIIGTGMTEVDLSQMKFTPRVHAVVRHADSMRRENKPVLDDQVSEEISPGHLLLGMVKDGQGIGAGVLEQLRIPTDVDNLARLIAEYSKA